MKWQAVLTIAVLSLGPTATGGRETSTEKYLLALDLRDGSRLRGSTPLASIPLDTAYGKLNLPTKLIRTITFSRKSAKGETWTVAAVDMSKGDRLHGRVVLKTLELETPYGKSTVPAAQIARMAVLPDMPAEGLVAFWCADGDANDSVGGHHGTVGKGVCYTADRHGNAKSAFLFNGRSGLVTVPDCDTLDTDCAFTLSAWIKPVAYQDDTGRYPMILSKWVSSRVHGDYILSLGQTGGRPRLHAGRGPAEDAIIAASAAPKAAWTHVAATFDRGRMSLYVNGRLEVTKVSDKVKRTDPAEYAGDDVFIGGLYSDHYNFSGAIDDVGIWNRALRPEEIARLSGPRPRAAAERTGGLLESRRQRQGRRRAAS